MPSPASATRAAPECVTLPAREGARPSGEAAGAGLPGQRAGPAARRAGLRLVDRARARPGARLRDLADEAICRASIARGWTTGFTNYRFAIPHSAGGSGRAIYNDVDQIYLADPAELFDRRLGGHGYARDRARRLVGDAARLRAHGGASGRSSARSASARPSCSRAALADPGLIRRARRAGTCATARTAAERSKLLHFTTLHTQPWRPFPEQFVYQENPSREALARRSSARPTPPASSVLTRARPSELSRWRARRGSPPAGSKTRPTSDVPPGRARRALRARGRRR